MNISQEQLSEYIADLQRLKAERDRYKAALNIVWNKVEEAHYLLKEDSFENDDEAISILASSMRILNEALEGGSSNDRIPR